MAALLLGGLYAPAVFSAGIPVEDRTDPSQGATSASTVNAAAARSSAVSDTRVTSVPRAAVSANAELLMMLSQLQEEVRFLRGRVEEQQHQLQRLQVDQRDRYRDLDRRIGLLGQRPVIPSSALPPALPSASASVVPQSGPVDSAPEKRTQEPVARPSVSDTQAYKAAFLLVRERDFDQALREFERFLKQYPDSELTANVLYWIGEVHRARPTPDQEKASIAYQQLLMRYPAHSKAADAYYKLGLSYQALGQLDKAKGSMARVIKLFPDQAPAAMARDFLKKNP
ncbi:MAG: tol-pal system protein YbgF [Motiliproteus sp.]|jgi:tol-pal system protein YbgF